MIKNNSNSNNFSDSQFNSNSNIENFYESCLINNEDSTPDEELINQVKIRLEGQKINEYDTPYLASMCFPTLFHDNKGDFTRNDIKYSIEESEAVNHLLKYSYIKNNKIIFPFVTHKTFVFWANNMIERRRLLSQSRFFVKNYFGDRIPEEADLKNYLADEQNLKVFILNSLKFTSNIRGTNPYWHSVRNNLINLFGQRGIPNIFLRFQALKIIGLMYRNYFQQTIQIIGKKDNPM